MNNGTGKNGPCSKTGGAMLTQNLENESHRSIRRICIYLSTLCIEGVGGDGKLSSPAINLS